MPTLLELEAEKYRKSKIPKVPDTHQTDAEKMLSLTQPALVAIELTDRCNAKCVFCGRLWWENEPKDMDFDFYCQIVDNLKPPTYLWLCEYGESLLYPRFVDAVVYAKQRGFVVKVVTNGSLLTETMTKTILDAGMDVLIISVDTCNKEEYEKMRVGLKFDTLVNNMKRLKQMRDAGGYKTEIIANALILPENRQRPEVEKFWKPYVDTMCFFGEGDVSFSKKPALIRMEAGICDQMTLMNIRVDGKVTLCCRDCQAAVIIGDVTKQKPLDVFNSELFRQIRLNMANGIYYEMCEGCSYITPEPRLIRRKV